jgi:hypothetical protein
MQNLKKFWPCLLKEKTVAPHSQPWGVSNIWFYDTHSVANTKHDSQVLRPPRTKRNAITWRGETKHIFLKRAKNMRMSSGNFRSRELVICSETGVPFSEGDWSVCVGV